MRGSYLVPARQQGLPIGEGKGKAGEIQIGAGPGFRAENPEYWAHTDATQAFEKVGHTVMYPAHALLLAGLIANGQ